MPSKFRFVFVVGLPIFLILFVWGLFAENIIVSAEFGVEESGVVEAERPFSPSSFSLAATEHLTSYLPIVMNPPTMKGFVSQYTLNLPEPLSGMQGSWCTWSGCAITPRLYHAPLDDGRTLVGWTDDDGDGHITIVSTSGTIQTTFNYNGRSLRGLVAHGSSQFAILLRDANAKIMWLSKRNINNSEVWSTNIDGSLTSFNPAIGDSRLAFGDDRYGAYFAVHGDSGWVAGHEGDALTYVNSSGIVQTDGGGWEWGCSHSMAELIDYHPVLGKFAPVCSSDCYASKGILINDSQVVYASDGNCGGLVSTQLGQIAQASNTWKMVFNAQAKPGFTGRGIGFATVNGSFQSSYTWLTNTNGDYERDPVLGRIGSSLSSDRYLVGWHTTNNDVYRLAIVNGAGSFIFPPEEVSSAGISWGNRDDSFKTGANGEVSWVQGDPSSSELHLYQFDGSYFLP